MQAYSHYYWKDRLRAIVHERYEKKLIAENDREPGDATPLPKIPWGFQTAVVTELYEAENAEFKAQLDVRRKAEKTPAVEEQDDGLRRHKMEMYQK